MTDGWVRGVVRYRVLVLVAWAAITFLGALSAVGLSNRLSTSLDVPGTSSARANALLARHFDENADGSFTVLVTSKHLSRSDQHRLEGRLKVALRSLPGASVFETEAVGDTWFADVSTPYDLAEASARTATLRSALARAGVSRALVTGAPALEHDLAPVLGHDLRVGLLVALVVTGLLLLAVLGLSWALLVPLVVAGASTALALFVIRLLALHVLMILYVPNVIELLVVGLSVDYSLLMVHRLRQEYRRGSAGLDAVIATGRTAGRTVATSALVVATGLVVLCFVPVPFVRSLGIAGLVAPGVALAAAWTLQPALLSLLGPGGLGVRRDRGLLGRDPSRGRWAALTRLVVSRPRRVLVVALVLVGALAASAWWLQLTPASLTALPSTMQSAKAINEVTARFGPGVVTPMAIVVDTGERGGASRPAQAAARLRLARAISRSSDVEIVAIGVKAPYVADGGRYEQIVVISRDAFGAPAAQALVRRVRSVLIPRANFPRGTTVVVGGAGAQGVDFLSRTYRVLPWLVALSLLATSAVLTWALGSLVVAVLSSLLALLSLAAAYGVVVAVFRFGVLSSLLGTYHVSQIEGWVPIFLYALLFGLSTDYQVFIAARIREARSLPSSGDDQRGALVEGFANTGGVISAAALVMVGALSGLVIGQVAGLQELGVGLAAGVLIDVTIVRALVLPSALALLGEAAWWRPRRHESPAIPEGTTGDSSAVSVT